MSRHWTELVMAWSTLVFNNNIKLLTPKVRSMRLLEEALELAQAEDVTRQDAETILAQVYAKPKGYSYNELGGVLVTMAAYAGTQRWDLENVFMLEFTRIMDPVVMERVRNRNLSGDKIGFHPEESPQQKGGCYGHGERT